MNSAPASPALPTISSGATLQTSECVRLRIRGLGPLFNFKNSKKRTRNGLITDPALKKRMAAIQASFVSQLNSLLRTGDDAIPTAARRLSLMRSLPHDDCWTVIPDLRITSHLCAPEDEGAEITIERINP